MILATNKETTLPTILDEIGLGSAIQKSGSVLLKINLARSPEPQYPRTAPYLLTQIVQYASHYTACCAIAESADGFLNKNLATIGLTDLLQKYQIKVIDLDQEETDCISVDGEQHYLPRCLRNYGVRIGIPATSKRPGMVFSNNVKLFVGVVPRRMYQTGVGGCPRPRIHIDLHKSVANLYQAVQKYAPFGFFVNGGKTMLENQGIIKIDETLVGNDALELDHFILQKYGLEPPEYIRRISGSN